MIRIVKVVKSFSESSEELLMSLSYYAVAGVQGRKTIKLLGFIQNQEVLILVDSGSSSNFISDRLVHKLGCTVSPCASAKVTIADGGSLQCNSMVKSMEWRVQGHTFTTDMKVLKLGYYDMILGIDWLDEFSPMWVHWRRKEFRFTYKGIRITLKGIKDSVNTCSMISGTQFSGLMKKGALAQVVQLCLVNQTMQEGSIPPEVQKTNPRQ